MPAVLESLATNAPTISADLAALAEAVSRSVVLIRDGGPGMGSGVVWDARGRILTNHHVVPGARAEVVLANGARRSARALANAPGLDLALLELDGPLPGAEPIRVRDSTTLRPGELLLAVGNPLGERNAVSLGVFSARVRGPRGEAIQSAIMLRPGNSGGALVDARGQLVGIPAMVIGPGIGLAVPSAVAQRFVAAAESVRERSGQPRQSHDPGAPRWV